jgi:plastocyanin
MRGILATFARGTIVAALMLGLWSRAAAQRPMMHAHPMIPAHPSMMFTPHQAAMLRRDIRLHDARVIRDLAILNRLALPGVPALPVVPAIPAFYPGMYTNPYMAMTPYGGGGYGGGGYGGGGYPMMGYGGYGAGSMTSQTQQSPTYTTTEHTTPAAAYSAPATRSPVNVTMYDDYFKPSLMTIPAGTTVQWTNAGKHHHTVNSAAGQWDSGDLQPGATFTHTFTEPGTFYYNCAHHSKTMRGIVTVN